MEERRLSNAELQRVADRVGATIAPGSRTVIGIPKHLEAEFDKEIERVKSLTSLEAKSERRREEAGELPLTDLGFPAVTSPGTYLSNREESNWADSAIPTALRVVPTLVGAGAGSLIAPVAGTVAGGAIGAGLGERLAQKYEAPGEDANWTQVGVQTVLGATPIGKMAQIAGLGGRAAMRLLTRHAGRHINPALTSPAATAARDSVGRMFAKSATASTPFQRVTQQLPRTIAKSAAQGAVMSATGGTPTRWAAGQPTTMGDIVRDVGYGMAFGGATPLAGRAAIGIQRGGTRLGGWAARNRVANATLTAAGSTLGGTAGWTAGGGPYGAATGAIAGYSAAQSALNKMKTWGRPGTLSGKEYKKSAKKILEDIEEIAKDLESVDSLSINMQAADMKKLADGVEYVIANNLAVSPGALRQFNRVKDVMLTPKANAALKRMSADENLDENGLIKIDGFTDTEALKYHDTLVEAIDSASRAGSSVTEKWRQAFEGLRERVLEIRGRDYASAIDSLVDSSIPDRRSFDLVWKNLPVKMQRNIEQNDFALLNIIKRRFELAGGRLNPNPPKEDGIIEMLESMMDPVTSPSPDAAYGSSSFAAKPTPGSGYTIPTDTRIDRRPGSAIPVDVNPELRGGTLRPRPGTEEPILQRILKEGAESDVIELQNASKAKPGSGSTVPTELDYRDYKPGSGSATPRTRTVESRAQELGAPPEVATRDRTVESRAQERGVAPEVASGTRITPSNIRELLSNRPGLEAAIEAQKLVGRTKIHVDSQGNLDEDFERFHRLYKDLSGSFPTEGKHYSPSHVLGLFYASGTNKTKGELGLIKRILTAVLKQPGMGSKESIGKLLQTMEDLG